jgi:large subunit ribosomal protein L12
MQYVYAALLLHSAGKKIDDAGVKKVLEASGDKPDAAKVKALVSSLEGVNIEEAIAQAAAAQVVAAPAAAEAKEEKKEEKKEEDSKKAEEAVEGLGSLFG